MASDMDLGELARQMRVNAMATALCTMLTPHIRPGQTVQRDTVDYLEQLVAELFQLVDANLQVDDSDAML